MASMVADMGKFVAEKVGSTLEAAGRSDLGHTFRGITQNEATVMKASPEGTSLMDLVSQLHQRSAKYTSEAITKGGAAAAGQQGFLDTVLKESKQKARTEIFGPKDINATMLLHNLASTTKNSLHTNNVADIVHMHLKDTVVQRGTQVSAFKANAYRYGEKLAKVTGDNPLADLNTTAVYKRAGKGEQFLTNWASKVLAPFIAIPHIGTSMNFAISTPLKDLSKGIASSVNLDSLPEIQEHLVKSGILAESLVNAFQNNIVFRNGFLAKAGAALGIPKSSEVANAINTFISTPGFSAQRRFYAIVGGCVGYHTAIDAAEQVGKEGLGAKRALVQLRTMGFHQDEIEELMRNGGVLRDAQKQKAIYHYVNDKIFLDRGFSRSVMSGANIWTRLGFMYHGYVSKQAALIYRELKGALQSGDPAHIVQTMTVLGVAFPAIGECLKHAEIFARSGKLNDPNEVDSNMVEAYLDAYSHMGGLGMGASFVRGAFRGRMAEVLLGPYGSVAARTTNDLATAIKSGKLGQHNVKPLERDVLEDTLPLKIGGYVAHHYLPTPKEKKGGK